MGKFNNKEGKDNNDIKNIKKNINKMKITALVSAVGLKIISTILVFIIITSVIQWVIKIFIARNTVNEIYKKAEIEDVCDLVEIKGNSTDGYYLDFKEDVDKKLEDIIDYFNHNAGLKTGVNKDFLKKLIKTEVAIKYPNLGGKIGTSSGFQGVTDIIRITPNKEFKSLKNTGAGEETIVNNKEDIKSQMINKDVVEKEEEIIKKWNKGKELTLAATAFIYDQEESKLHPGEKIDYWVPQKDKNTTNNLQIKENEIVTYTGNYSVSMNNLTNEGLIYVEIEKDKIKGYIKYSYVLKDSNEQNSSGIIDEEFVDNGFEEKVEERIVDTIDSNVYKLSYIPEKQFEEYITKVDKTILKYFTIDKDGNIITATWQTNAAESIEFIKNSPMSLETVLQDLVMPFAYLMYFYIEADYEGFSSDLADKVLNSKILVALEDDVNTEETTVVTEQKKISESSQFSYDWTVVSNIHTLTEHCNTKTDIIYADTWCFKLINKDMYKDELLDIKDGGKVNLKMPGTVTETISHKMSGESKVGTGVDTVEHVEYNNDGSVKSKTYEYFSYTLYQRSTTDYHGVANTYATGEKEIQPKENVFVDLYKKHKMYNRVNANRLLKHIIEKDERTANLAELTKYLIYKATGVAYDEVKEYDFSVYESISFEDYSSYYGDYVVKTNDSNSAPVIKDKAELEKGLKKWLKTSTNMKSNALSVLDTVFECQEKYHVNAVFTYAFLRKETGIGTANTNYVNVDNNWGSWLLGHKYSSPADNIITITSKIESGNIYFTKGNITVSKIGAIYCPNDSKHPTQGDDWISGVTNFMSDLYTAMGITPTVRRRKYSKWWKRDNRCIYIFNR